MSTMQISIQKKGQESFEFTFYRNSPSGELDSERSEIVKIMDEATDAIMRLPQRIECEQLNSSSPVHRIKIVVGKDALNK